MKIAIEQILEWDPCEEYDTVEKIVAETDEDWPKTPLQIASLLIPAEDRLWVLLRPEIIPEKRLHLLACDFAEDVLEIFETKYPNDNRPRLAIETKHRWVHEEATTAELAAARDAAMAAAWAAMAAARDAARAAARDAARAAARDARAAAWDAARTAAWDAVRAAARDAVRAAARDAAVKRQLRQTVKVLEGFYEN